MSAFVVSAEHIDALVWAGIAFRARWGGERTRRGASETGAMLLDQNIRSVGRRHPESPRDDLPGPTAGLTVETYVFRFPHRHYAPVEILKALHCYEYQSCEDPAWDDSEARRYCKALESAVRRLLPPSHDPRELEDYARAAWEVAGAE